MVAKIVKSLKVCLVAVGVAAGAAADEAGTAKWNAMAARYQIGFPRALVEDGATVNNFPMPVRLGAANNFSIAGIAANQVRFFVSDIPGGGYIEVPFEVECWEQDTDRALVWVKIPSVVSHQTIYMGVLAEGSDEGLDPHAVWSDYHAVWHMNDAALVTTSKASDGLADATGHGHAGTMFKKNNGDMWSVDSALGKGVAFKDVTGADEALLTSGYQIDHITELFGAKTFTVETIASTTASVAGKFDKLISWRKVSSGGTGKDKYLLSQQIQDNLDGVRVDLAGKKPSSSTVVNWQGFKTADASNPLIRTDGTEFFTGFIANESGMMTNIVEKTVAEAPFQGTKNADDNQSNTGAWGGLGADIGVDNLTGANDKLCIGGRSDYPASWRGVIDEVRIATVARSAAFLALVRDSAVDPEWVQTISNADEVNAALSVLQTGVNRMEIYFALSGVPHATATLQLATDDTFGTLADTRALAVSAGPVYLVTGLTPGQTYFARVKAESAALTEPVYSQPVEVNLISDAVAFAGTGFIYRGAAPSLSAVFSGDARLVYSAQLLAGGAVAAELEAVTPDSGIAFPNADLGGADRATVKLTAVSPFPGETLSVERTVEIAVTAGACSGVLQAALLNEGYFFIGETVTLAELPDGWRYDFVNAYGVEIGADGRSFTCRHASPLGVEVVNGGPALKYGALILPNRRGETGDVWVRELVDGYALSNSGNAYLSRKECQWKCVTNPSRSAMSEENAGKSSTANIHPGDNPEISGDIAVLVDRGLRSTVTSWINAVVFDKWYIDEFYYFNMSPNSNLSPKLYKAYGAPADAGLHFTTSDGKPGRFVYDAIWYEANSMFGSGGAGYEWAFHAPNGVDLYFGRADLGDTQLGAFGATASLKCVVPPGKAVTIKSGSGNGKTPPSIMDGDEGRLSLSGGGAFRNETAMKCVLCPTKDGLIDVQDDTVIESVGGGVSGEWFNGGFMVKKSLYSRAIDADPSYTESSDKHYTKITNSVYGTLSPTLIFAARGHAGSIVPNLDGRYPDSADARGSFTVGTQKQGAGIQNAPVRDAFGEPASNTTDDIGNRLDSVKKIILDGGTLGVYGERVYSSNAWPEGNRLLTTTVNELELRPGFNIFNVGGDTDTFGNTNDVHVARTTPADGAFLVAYNARLMRKSGRDNGFLTFDGMNAVPPWLFVYDETHGLLPATVTADGLVGPADVSAPVAVTGGTVFRQGDAVAVSAAGDCTVGADAAALGFTGYGYMTFTSAAADLADTVTISQPVTAPAGLALAAPRAGAGRVVLGGDQRGIGGKGLTLAIGTFELSGVKVKSPVTVVGGATEAVFAGRFRSVSSLNLVSAGMTAPRVDPGADGVFVSELYIDGVKMADGTYGSAASAAEHTSAFFTGTGVVTVDSSLSARGTTLILR